MVLFVVISCAHNFTIHLRSQNTWNMIVCREAARAVLQPRRIVPTNGPIELPLPADKIGLKYSKKETINLLLQTKKNSNARKIMLRNMLKPGYAPKAERTIRRWLKDDEDSNPNVPVTPTRCRGIRSHTLDKYGKHHAEYCNKVGWTRDINNVWYSKACQPENADENLRCVKCRSAYNNMNKRRHPKLFKMPDLLPTADTISSQVCSRLQDLHAYDIAKDEKLADIARIMRHNGHSILDLGDSNVFIACSGCDSHRVCQKRSCNVDLCSICQRKKKVGKWQEKRREREENKDHRVSPSSNVAWKNLTSQEAAIRSKKLKDLSDSHAAKVQRIEKKIESQMIELELTEELLNHMSEALAMAQADKAGLRESIQNSLADILKEEGRKLGADIEKISTTNNETNQLVEFIAESMHNHIHKMEGNENLYRFSPYLAGLSLNQYIQAGPTAYEQMRKDSVIIVPSADTQARKLCFASVWPGCILSGCARRYSMFARCTILSCFRRVLPN